MSLINYNKIFEHFQVNFIIPLTLLFVEVLANWIFEFNNVCEGIMCIIYRLIPPESLMSVTLAISYLCLCSMSNHYVVAGGNKQLPKHENVKLELIEKRISRYFILTFIAFVFLLFILIVKGLEMDKVMTVGLVFNGLGFVASIAVMADYHKQKKSLNLKF